MTALVIPVTANGAIAVSSKTASSNEDGDEEDKPTKTNKDGDDKGASKEEQSDETSAPKVSSSKASSSSSSLSKGSIPFGANSNAKKKKVQGVVELNWRNFDDSISDGNLWLVEFYAPWCKHCTNFAAAYDVVARNLHSRHDDESSTKGERKVMVARVDGSAERALAVRFGISGFPSFFLLDGWTIYEYKGTVTLQGLVDFATDTTAAEPIPFLSSPFGPLGQLRMRTLQLGIRSYHLYEHLLKEHDVTSFTAGSLVMGTGLVAGLASVLTIGILLETKHKPE